MIVNHHEYWNMLSLKSTLPASFVPSLNCYLSSEETGVFLAPCEEFIQYEQEAILEETQGYPEIAAYWRKAAKAAKVVMERNSFLGKIHDIKTIPPIFEAKENFSASQHSTAYITSSFKALNEGDFLKAQEFSSAAKRITVAATKFEYWRRRAHEEALTAHLFDEKETAEMVSTYRVHQARALLAHQKRIAQQWAEAACLAQWATYKIKKRTLLLLQKENSTRTLSLLLAASWAKKAALFRAKVATALEQGNKKEIQHAINVACAAEEAALYRSKAARMVKQNDQMISHYWTMAAYWTANSAYYQEERSPLWKEASALAKKTSRTYAQAAKNKNSCFLPCWLWQITRLEKKLEILLQETSSRLLECNL